MRISKSLMDSVIDEGFCVGCGACAFASQGKVSMKLKSDGMYTPEPAELLNDESSDICPFSDTSIDENRLGEQLFGDQHRYHDDYLGYYLSTHAGKVRLGDYREKGSSGGMVTWIAVKLLEENLIDKVIHVKPSITRKEALFCYSISSSTEEIRAGAKSKYYPVEISQVLQYVEDNEGNYLFIGVPCFIKAIRLLSVHRLLVKDRIRFTIGLVCGHLKSDRYAKAMSWQMGIAPENLIDFDFRYKTPNEAANRYGVKAVGLQGDTLIEKVVSSRELFVANWGYGMFKYKACDYCDDVLAETADVSLGDAWLPEYVKDSDGTNIVIVRNPIIESVIMKYEDELYLDDLSSDRIVLSQAGGFRHRRQGLAYRLFLLERENKWYPKKRVQPSDKIDKKRKKIYTERIALREKSHELFLEAERVGDFNKFMVDLKPYLQKYDKLVQPKLITRLYNKAKVFLSKSLSILH